ncbi:MAG: hypothetical protein KMY53_15070 [Desulfarculus sp.]|nr:hypothetical protein [Pseudomonadota bacterium]MBV1717178.1 hypothetical protein [Desulfarculus sp.]MBU4576678.1 hypothetical protein [Pseudomonadota bacterium]MBU4598404.1 hypothetical protein [Pseudomonadota bacterium]MBV1739486.1 hypothetical protein [Desulfarculus sp.]
MSAWLQGRGLLMGLLLAALTALACGAPAWAQTPPPDPTTASYRGFFPGPQPQGEVPLTLVPHPRALSQVVPVSFGMPFPPGYVSDPKLISLVDNTGQEIPIHVEVLANWLPPVPGAPCIRSVLIQYQDYMASPVPRTYTLRWGKPRQKTMAKGWPASRAWLSITDNSYPALTVKDPTVWALLPASWLGKALIKGRLAPAGTYPAFHWYEEALGGFYQQAINQPVLNKNQQVHPERKKRFGIDYLNTYEPWLLDRTTTIFLRYLTTGDLKPYKFALRDVQFYAHNVQENGNFALLKPGRPPNVIYGNQEALTIAWFFTGLTSLQNASKRVVKLLDRWYPEYSPERTFWTERHLAFHLMIATAAYEMTGDPALLARARHAMDIAIGMQTSPPPGAPKDGCLIHTGVQHSSPVKGWTCSPWMSVLFEDAAMRYYLVSADPRVPQLVLNMADYFITHGIYRRTPKNSKILFTYPYYMASSVEKAEISSMDWQHCLDTGKLLVLAIYFARKQNLPWKQYLKIYEELVVSAKEMLPKHRTGRITPYTLFPPRKFSWWFRTTADIPWLLNQP